MAEGTVAFPKSIVGVSNLSVWVRNSRQTTVARGDVRELWQDLTAGTTTDREGH